MTYKELYESAIDRLEKSKITLGEFEEMIEPLNAEIATADLDTISRQAAIDGKICIQRANGVEIYDDYAVPVEYLEQLPPAQPERIKGHWIDAVIPNDNGGLPVQICDQCNTFYPLAYTGGGHHYCPNCGAKMEVTE